jgi:hypothetical protein
MNYLIYNDVEKMRSCALLCAFVGRVVVLFGFTLSAGALGMGLSSRCHYRSKAA